MYWFIYFWALLGPVWQKVMFFFSKFKNIFILYVNNLAVFETLLNILLHKVKSSEKRNEKEKIYIHVHFYKYYTQHKVMNYSYASVAAQRTNSSTKVIGK